MAFDHPDNDILSNTPDKEYLNKVHRLATGGYKDINRSEELFDIYEMQQRNNWEDADSVYDAWLLSNNMPRKCFSYKKIYKYVSRMGNTKVTYVQQREFGTVLIINTNKEGKFDFNDTMTSLSEKLSSCATESASESESHNLLISDNEMLPDSQIKRKRKQRRIQLLCAEELSEEQPPESYERKT